MNNACRFRPPALFYSAGGSTSSQLSVSCVSLQCRFAWQFAQSTSHFLISFVICLRLLARETRADTAIFFSALFR